MLREPPPWADSSKRKQKPQSSVKTMAENTPLPFPFQSCNSRKRIYSGSGDSVFFSQFPSGCSRTRYPENLFWMAGPVNANIRKTSFLPSRNVVSWKGHRWRWITMRPVKKLCRRDCRSTKTVGLIFRCRWVAIRWHSRKISWKRWYWAQLFELTFEEMWEGFAKKGGASGVKARAEARLGPYKTASCSV